MRADTQAKRPAASAADEPHRKSSGPPDAPDRLRTAARVTVLGALANALLTALKAAVGLAGGSSVLVADAAHSLSDLATDILVLLGLRMASKPPDEGHPYGHGRYETIATGVLAGALLLVAGGIAWDASTRFGAATKPASITLWVAALSIAVKETLFRVTLQVGRRCHSSLVVANAWHHRSDALSSIAAFAGILGARMGFPALDPAAAVLVAALIAKTAFQLLGGALREVTDATLERELLQQLGVEIRRLPGVVSFHQLRARRMGPRLLVDLNVVVDGSTTVSDGHQVAERVRQLLFQKQAGISEVLVHVDPEPDEGVKPGVRLARPREEIETEVRRIALGVEGVRAVTHVLIHFLERRVVLQIEIEVDPGLRVREAAAVARALRRRVEAVRDVDHADIHLELDDLAHEELPPILQGPRSQGGSGDESKTV